MAWSAQQYTRFEQERTRPVRDLLAPLPPLEVRTAVDVGCGPGNSTEVLAARYPAARISAFDSSTDMIEAARRRLPEVDFAVADVAAWRGAPPYDLIMANAVLHWVPDHRTLLPALLAKLGAGGALAVQMPDTLDELPHRLMCETAAEGPWAARLEHAGMARTPLAAPAWYYALLKPLCRAVDLWRTTYLHALPGGAPAIVEWFKGTGLRPFLEPLDAQQRDAYLALYTRKVAAAYPLQPDGSVLLPFPRLFLLALR
jgi:trans-aconitate 2-methyltransferase